MSPLNFAGSSLIGAASRKFLEAAAKKDEEILARIGARARAVDFPSFFRS